VELLASRREVLATLSPASTLMLVSFDLVNCEQLAVF
jgi:hypothetical protein